MSQDKSNDIEIVAGNGEELDISPVSNHICKPESNKRKDKKIVIPKEKKDEKKD